MALITIKPVKSKSYLFFRDEKQFASVEYNGIFRTSATVTSLNNQIYNLERVSFLLRKYQLKQGAEIFATGQVNFLGSISITLAKTGETFIIKRKSLIHGRYILTDGSSNEVFSVYYKYNLFNRDQLFSIETTELFDKIKDNLFLCYISIFSIFEKIKDTKYVP